MAASNELEVKLSGDASGVVAAANQTTKALAAIPKSSGQATTALVNLGRVVQDAPFGLIGIANNIDPLITSFQSLSKTSGGAGSAFKALGAALAGPAGIAIAVSAVTSAFIAFGPEIKKAILGSNAFGEAINQAAEGAAKDAIKVNVLTEAIKSGTLTAKEQTIAQKELIKINPEFKGAFEKGAISVDKLDKALQSANQQLFNQIKISAATNILQKEFEKLAATVASGGELTLLEKINTFANGFQFKSLSEKVVKTDKLNSAKQQIQEFGKRINEVFNAIGISYGDYVKNTESAKVKTKELGDILKQYKEDLRVLNLQEAAGNAEIFRQKLDLATKTFQDFVSKGISPARREFQFIQEEINKYLALLPQIKAFNEEQQKLFNPDPSVLRPDQQPKRNRFDILLGPETTSSVILNPEFQTALDAYKKKMDEVNERIAKQKELLDVVKNTIESGIGASVDQLFNALANNQDPFKALAQSAARLVTELAAAVVKALILKAFTAAFTQGGSLAANGLTPAAGIFGKVRGQDLQLLTLLRV